MQVVRQVWAMVLAAWLGLFAGGAAAADATAADAQAVRRVIQAQLKAFAADDAAAAFAFASPAIREQFDSAEGFMAMVRESYPVVYRPASVNFLKPDVQGDMLLQRVQMTDAEGVLWVAIYELRRQRDNGWLINGCVVVKGRGQAA